MTSADKDKEYKEEDFQSYSIEDDEEDTGVFFGGETLWRTVPQIMVTPAAGWRRVKENGPSPELATLRFLLPLSLISGASVFFTLLYPHNIELDENQSWFTFLLVSAVIQFCSFFIGYYFALVLAKVFLPKADRFLPSSRYGKLLTMTGVGTLAFFHILYKAFPMLDTILVFLPLWTIFIIYKGLALADIKEEKSLLAMGVMCVAIVCAPTLIEWILVLFT